MKRHSNGATIHQQRRCLDESSTYTQPMLCLIVEEGRGLVRNLRALTFRGSRPTEAGWLGGVIGWTFRKAPTAPRNPSCRRNLADMVPCMRKEGLSIPEHGERHFRAADSAVQVARPSNTRSWLGPGARIYASCHMSTNGTQHVSTSGEA